MSFQSAYTLHWAGIKYALENGYHTYNFYGITGDFSQTNPYKGLNDFKLGFKPRIYEYIGEYDLPIQKNKYQKLRSNGELAKIFNKTDIKIIKKEKGGNDDQTKN